MKCILPIAFSMTLIGCVSWTPDSHCTYYDRERLFRVTNQTDNHLTEVYYIPTHSIVRSASTPASYAIMMPPGHSLALHGSQCDNMIATVMDARFLHIPDDFFKED